MARIVDGRSALIGQTVIGPGVRLAALGMGLAVGTGVGAGGAGLDVVVGTGVASGVGTAVGLGSTGNARGVGLGDGIRSASVPSGAVVPGKARAGDGDDPSSLIRRRRREGDRSAGGDRESG